MRTTAHDPIDEAAMRRAHGSPLRLRVMDAAHCGADMNHIAHNAAIERTRIAVMGPES